MSKVLFINGSPNEHGCTATAMEETIRVLEEQGIETEMLWLGKKAVPDCIACGSCHKQNQGGSGRQTLQHQSHCNGDAAGGAKVHGDAEDEHKENAVERVVLKDNKPRIGNDGRYDASHNKPNCQPLPNVLHHLPASIGKSTKESF